MTPKKSYSRYFIILQEDEKGYSLDSDKIPSGYAKLEMKNNKCKISYYVQNLRKEKQPYYMILICGKKDVNRIIKLGKLNIDDYGRVDISHEYDIENIADTGISSEKIIGAAIVKFLDTNVISIMSGFSTSDKPNEWKGYKIADFHKENSEIRAEGIANEFDEYEQSIELIKGKDDEKAHEIVESLYTEKNVKEIDSKQRTSAEAGETTESIEAGETTESTEITETVRSVIKVEEVENVEKVKKLESVEITEDLKSTKEVGNTEDANNIRNVEKNQDIEDQDQPEERPQVNEVEDGVNADMQRNKNQSKKDACSDKGEYPKGAMGDFFKGVAQGFDEVSDFSKEIKWCKWYKVPVKNLENMYDLSDYNKYTVAYYPMICYYPYIKNHKSFMLGYKCDSTGKMKYIVYGIPGTKAKAHQPYGGKTGFVTWISDKENGEMGHWLMFYDFKKSTIVVPVKK